MQLDPAGGAGHCLPPGRDTISVDDEQKEKIGQIKSCLFLIYPYKTKLDDDLMFVCLLFWRHESL